MKSGPDLIVCFDTNVLIYAFTPGDPRHDMAASIVTQLSARGGPLPLQVLREFLAVAHRKRFLPLDAACEAVTTLDKRFEIRAAGVAEMARASRMASEHQVNFYDAMICIVARDAGAGLLLSEDMTDGAVLDGLRILNPFAGSNRKMLASLSLT